MTSAGALVRLGAELLVCSHLSRRMGRQRSGLEPCGRYPQQIQADTRLEMVKQVGACPCHTCSRGGHLISGMVMRFSGSTSSMRGMRSRAPGDRWLGRL